jgi:hypothetical protein
MASAAGAAGLDHDGRHPENHLCHGAGVGKEADVSLTSDIRGPGMTMSPDEQAVNLASRILYLKSYLLMRAIIGFIGVTLPFLLVLGDNLLKTIGPVLRGSLSAYYYSGMRDFLVASLAAAAFFLIAYKIFERSASNVLSLIAGLAILTTAFFPTDRGSDVNAPLTPLQAKLGEATVVHVHFVAAGIAIVSLAVISFIFGLQEGRRSPERAGQPTRLSPTFWRWFHWTLAAIILISVAFAAYSERQHVFTTYSLLIGESVALEAFGLSWLFKGLELDVLLTPQSRQDRKTREVAAQTP